MRAGIFVISYGDAPSLYMVRVLVPVSAGFTAPYLRADRHLRRYDSNLITSMDDFTPLSAWGRDLAITTAGKATIVLTGEPETAVYPEDNTRRPWQGYRDAYLMDMNRAVGMYVLGLMTEKRAAKLDEYVARPG
jgi:hypothetical protein